MTSSIHCAIDVAPLGELSDPAEIVRLALAAEAAGWDGISVWDNFGVSMDTSAADPFVTLAAVAAATRRIRLITSVIALPRRRPHVVAQAIGTLDRLSGGRCTVGVGAGGDSADFERFGEPYDVSSRLGRFDEGLDLLDRFLRGESVEHRGPTYVVRGAAVGPRPVQQPRPPIWIGGMRPGALRRAARFDGWIAIGVADDGSGMALTPQAFGAMVRRLREERAGATANGPFDVAIFGMSDPSDPDRIADYAAQGASWWLESLSPMRGRIDALLALVEAGPPA